MHASLCDNPQDSEKDPGSQEWAGRHVYLAKIADIEYTRGAQMIRSENTFLAGYVIFDKIEGKAGSDVVEEAGKVLHQKIFQDR